MLKGQPSEGVKIDIGCGENKQPGFIGIDYEAFRGVDIVHNLLKFPWPLPDKCANLLVASHVLEHIPPFPPDQRVNDLIRLLLKKKIVNAKEIAEYVGEVSTEPTFMRFMDEAWRILKPGGQFMIAVPYATSRGFAQDPTHINMINEVTWIYFDPLHEQDPGAVLYSFYKPKPWKVLANAWTIDGNLEVVLEKRVVQKKYVQAKK